MKQSRSGKKLLILNDIINLIVLIIYDYIYIIKESIFSLLFRREWKVFVRSFCKSTISQYDERWWAVRILIKNLID